MAKSPIDEIHFAKEKCKFLRFIKDHVITKLFQLLDLDVDDFDEVYDYFKDEMYHEGENIYNKEKVQEKLQEAKQDFYDPRDIFSVPLLINLLKFERYPDLAQDVKLLKDYWNKLMFKNDWQPNESDENKIINCMKTIESKFKQDSNWSKAGGGEESPIQQSQTSHTALKDYSTDRTSTAASDEVNSQEADIHLKKLLLTVHEILKMLLPIDLRETCENENNFYCKLKNNKEYTQYPIMQTLREHLLEKKEKPEVELSTTFEKLSVEEEKEESAAKKDSDRETKESAVSSGFIAFLVTQTKEKCLVEEDWVELQHIRYILHNTNIIWDTIPTKLYKYLMKKLQRVYKKSCDYKWEDWEEKLQQNVEERGNDFFLKILDECLMIPIDGKDFIDVPIQLFNLWKLQRFKLQYQDMDRWLEYGVESQNKWKENQRKRMESELENERMKWQRQLEMDVQKFMKERSERLKERARKLCGWLKHQFNEWERQRTEQLGIEDEWLKVIGRDPRSLEERQAEKWEQWLEHLEKEPYKWKKKLDEEKQKWLEQHEQQTLEMEKQFEKERCEWLQKEMVEVHAWEPLATKRIEEQEEMYEKLCEKPHSDWMNWPEQIELKRTEWEELDEGNWLKKLQDEVREWEELLRKHNLEWLNILKEEVNEWKELVQKERLEWLERYSCEWKEEQSRQWEKQHKKERSKWLEKHEKEKGQWQKEREMKLNNLLERWDREKSEIEGFREWEEQLHKKELHEWEMRQSIECEKHRQEKRYQKWKAERKKHREGCFEKQKKEQHNWLREYKRKERELQGMNVSSYNFGKLQYPLLRIASLTEHFGEFHVISQVYIDEDVKLFQREREVVQNKLAEPSLESFEFIRSFQNDYQGLVDKASSIANSCSKYYNICNRITHQASSQISLNFSGEEFKDAKLNDCRAFKSIFSKVWKQHKFNSACRKLIFVAHGGINKKQIKIDALKNRVKDVTLFPPWGCLLHSSAAYQILKGAVPSDMRILRRDKNKTPCTWKEELIIDSSTKDAKFQEKFSSFNSLKGNETIYEVILRPLNIGYAVMNKYPSEKDSLTPKDDGEDNDEYEDLGEAMKDDLTLLKILTNFFCKNTPVDNPIIIPYFSNGRTILPAISLKNLIDSIDGITPKEKHGVNNISLFVICCLGINKKSENASVLSIKNYCSVKLTEDTNEITMKYSGDHDDYCNVEVLDHILRGLHINPQTAFKLLKKTYIDCGKQKEGNSSVKKTEKGEKKKKLNK